MVNKTNIRSCLGISIFLLAVAGLAQAATITVGPGVGYDFSSIQAGIDAAVDEDTVLVAPSEYVINEPITFRGKAITVISESGPDETIIRMDTLADTNRGCVVVFENNETTASVLDGFTITGGTGCRLWAAKIGEAPRLWWEGGGILFNASSGNVKNCTIVQNRAEAGGGVSVFSESCAILTNCIINENSSTDPEGAGAGVLCSHNSSVTMTECIIRDNSTIGAGGGVMSYLNSSATMTNCEIISNTAGRLGGGIYVIPASATLTNCVIARNTGEWGGGGLAAAYGRTFIEITNCTITGNSGATDAGGGGVLSYGVGSIGVGSITITNSVVCGNTCAKGPEISLMGGEKISVAYSNVAGGQVRVNVEGGSMLDWGEGNIDADPCFADQDNDDYHLKSEAGRWDSNSQLWVQDDVTSPCIDAGDPDSDWRAELWPHDIRANMGAYGGTLHASRSLSNTGNIADLNRDGIVDDTDICMIVDYWLTDEPYCDIAPAPFGDGMVDVQDMAILGENLFEDYRLDLIPMIAHWKMDEISGNSAYDSISSRIGTLYSDPIWQPATGYVNGALMFDGIDDYVSTDFVLNPVDGSFSAFIWVKGGTPGQVIISQVDRAVGRTVLLGSIWLGTDLYEGRLITGLMGFTFGALESESVITDGQWHHVGLVYDLDSLHRRLYVDGVQVAEDSTIVSGMSSDGGMYIGAGKTLDVASFFSGLIDDVRIYDRALSPEEITALAQ